ncbi:MAG: helix-turn-helix domain-containing protein [Limnochordia bacterium]|jgi:AraC-like DNA-binding protein
MYGTPVPTTSGRYGRAWDTKFCLRLLHQPIFCEHHVHQNYVYTTHQHIGIEFLFCQSGHGVLTLNKQPFPFTAPILVQYASTMPHSLLVHGTYARWNVCIQPDVLLSLLGEPEQPGYPLGLGELHGLRFMDVPQKHLAKLENLFIDINDEVTGQPPLYAKMAFLKLQELSCMVERLRQTCCQTEGDTKKILHGRQIEQLADIHSYIEANLADNVSAQSIAAAFHYSEKHVYRLINKLTGQSLGSYIKEQRMKRAQSLLIGTDLSIAAIGKAVGIADAAQFSRAFRDLTNCSPSDFRKACRRTSADANELF